MGTVTHKEMMAARKRMHANLVAKAAPGRGNPAFERLMRAALGPRLNTSLGWK